MTDSPTFAPHDTDSEARRLQLEAYRRIGSQGRAEAVFRLIALARDIAVTGIRNRHPDYDDAQVQRALLRLRYGDVIARAVWPALPLVEP